MITIRNGDIGETERRIWIPAPEDVPLEEPSPQTAPAEVPELVPA